jgi:hypothetical protein
MVMEVTKSEDQLLQLRKEEREKIKSLEIKARVLIGFYFFTQDTIEGVSGFMIDSHTIKRGDLEANAVI